MSCSECWMCWGWWLAAFFTLVSGYFVVWIFARSGERIREARELLDESRKTMDESKALYALAEAMEKRALERLNG